MRMRKSPTALSRASEIITTTFVADLIAAVTDNHGATEDRFTVWMKDNSFMTMGMHPWNPNEPSAFGENAPFSEHALDETEEVISFDRLPPPVQLHFVTMLRASYAVFIEGEGADLSDDEVKAAILSAHNEGE